MDKGTSAESIDFKWGDVTILVKKKATDDDRRQCAAVAMTPGAHRSAEMQIAYCRLVCRLMVTDWKGVMRDGIPVDYDSELLAQLPGQPGRYLFFELVMFIHERTDLMNWAHKWGNA